MLSNLVITPQRLTIVIDDVGLERISQKFLTQLLKEQGEDGLIRTLPMDSHQEDIDALQKFLTECNIELSDGKKWNVILPNFSDFLSYQKPSDIFQFINKLKASECIKRTFIWVSKKHLQLDHAQFFVAALEYMADLVLHLQTEKELSVLTRKSGGGVTNNRYTYIKSKNEFMVQSKNKEETPKISKNDVDVDSNNQKGTFKIELDEEEMVARNAMKLPYEKASEDTESNIIYTPDAADDFDDEDPDEDLNI